ncbi:xanthine/CO dehydrogenase XdhC/CoxF family maturation factor [Scopulibacillus daqui]|uniref:Xanthine/CO dehydrogenase XdhC/CoxF family maturation factor n=1 Tax=Scopulibacillus daqui TaxID=1469162 RepID=A0ABS2PVR5_9BACL|nr:XdhC family protein [Scopulibacillus daqui]MBM7644105.1 xanthine/CO dehydrogenase XdhC/CoxF family maturation factor [Scopulibacillus daqui]
MSRSQEFIDILGQMQQAWDRGEETALLTVIDVRGSAYRQPGTKMMMTMNGYMYGTISGGCLENDLLVWVQKAIREKKPAVIKYDLSDNEIWSLGIGCKGTLEIFILPVTKDEPFWRTTRQILQSGRTVSLVMEVSKGWHALIGKDGACCGEAKILPDAVYKQAIHEMSHQTRAKIIEIENHRFVIDVLRPNERLIVAGAGPDAQPVAALASKVGFSVIVVDPREYWNNAKRFPSAAHAVSEPAELHSRDVAQSWWVIMNHHFERDRSALQLALQSDPYYIGVLGPMARTKEMLDMMGCTFTSGPIHSPVGLDLGAETIDEVAISIVSELLSVRNNRKGASLHGKKKIHG